MEKRTSEKTDSEEIKKKKRRLEKELKFRQNGDLSMNKPKLVSSTPEINASLDWNACALCQKEGVFVCPANNVVETKKNMGYISLATNLETLRPYSYVLESGLSVEKPDEGGGILQTIITRKAKYHKACSVKYLHPKFEKLLEKQKKKKTYWILWMKKLMKVKKKKTTRLSESYINLKEEICLIKELDRCGCKIGCRNNQCSCKKSNLPCTPACKICHGDCHNASKSYIEDEEEEI